MGGHVQRCLLVAVPDVHIGAALDKELAYLRPSVECGQQQRCPPLASILGVHLRPMPHQQLADLQVALLGGAVQRRAAHAAGGVGVCTSVEEHLADLKVAAVGRGVDGRVSALVLFARLVQQQEQQQQEQQEEGAWLG